MNEANTLADIAGQDETVEQEILRKGLTAPRVTPADIEANIVASNYFTGAEGVIGAAGLARGEYPGPLNRLTFCVLTLRNGYTVVGYSSCASAENFNAELGRKLARQKAIDQLWPLMGYALREQLAKQDER